ncbi:hypothetical protein G210_3927 [Candida maltosa Xu316]|uniref:Uncharacterized protein n=1 Tax=Candida maltosa (strain Xu316) TaxID=1245528 RepID=M3HF25_CANMX|nr:hypothetical protein G210_3927 [Candida maltosa Xu316]
MSLPIPDLRFEQSFMRSLNKYAGNHQPSAELPLGSKTYSHVATLTDADLQLMNQQLDDEEEEELYKPLNPITPSIIIYAIIKDQILMPLLQGFLWTGLLISVRPFLGLIVKNGQNAGHWVSNLLGLNKLTPRRRTLA